MNTDAHACSDIDEYSDIQCNYLLESAISSYTNYLCSILTGNPDFRYYNDATKFAFKLGMYHSINNDNPLMAVGDLIEWYWFGNNNRNTLKSK